MAPSTILFMDHNRPLTTKEKNKLRKPMVEKLRRDRMNSSIEQLKCLLEKEFQRHQPNSKLEKADILEMAVDYLKQQNEIQVKGSLSKDTEMDFQEGYFRCLQEASQFMFLHKVSPKAQDKLMRHFQHNVLPGSEYFSSLPCRTPSAATTIQTLWRPWTEPTAKC